MEIQTILDDGPPRELSYVNFDRRDPFGVRLFLDVEVPPLRVAHVDGVAVSALFAAAGSDGVAELYLYGVNERSSKSSHYHITELTKNAGAYAKAIGVKAFRVTFRHGRDAFLKRRFPKWKPTTGFRGQSAIILEVEDV